MKAVPIETVSLFRDINASLVELLESLAPEEWLAPTLFPTWTVKDVAAHLLDTSIRRLSRQRDGWMSPEEVKIGSYRDLVVYITGLADRWAAAYQGVSPRILISMIKTWQDELTEFLEAQDPFAPALFNVAWAGEETSENWFDFAREYTERWLHQMHIVDALDRPTELLDRRYYHPLLDTFMQALPHHYRLFDPPGGTLYRFTVAGEAGGPWVIRRGAAGWSFTDEDADGPFEAEVTLPEDRAWKILTKALKRADALTALQWTGDESVARHLLGMTCVMA